MSQRRRFLKKNAFPSILNHRRNESEIDEPFQVQTEDPLSSCSLCASCCHHLTSVYEDHINMIRKCLPFPINSECMQRLCSECINALTTITVFIDKIAQNLATNSSYDQEVSNNRRRIKVEPVSSYEGYEEEKPSSHVTDGNPQKKCQILEIVDINFLCSNNDEQILSPHQLKVELEDPEDDVEQIFSYVRLDHNYNKEESVKAEVITTVKICKVCCKSFKTIRSYLLHKNNVHATKSYRKLYKLRRSKQVPPKFTKPKSIDSVQQKESPLRRPTVKKVYSCPTCRKEFPGPKNLYQHKLSHNGNSSYICTTCSKRFKRPHGLKQHIKSVHEKERNHICSICKHGYLLKADMIKCRHSKLKKLQLKQSHSLSQK